MLKSPAVALPCHEVLASGLTPAVLCCDVEGALKFSGKGVSDGVINASIVVVSVTR